MTVKRIKRVLLRSTLRYLINGEKGLLARENPVDNSLDGLTILLQARYQGLMHRSWRGCLKMDESKLKIYSNDAQIGVLRNTLASAADMCTNWEDFSFFFFSEKVIEWA